MRVIFVGVHNKPGMYPLDSRTMTGRVIDRIIKELPDGYHCIKSNVFNIDYWPQNQTDELNRQWVENWKERMDYKPTDIVVTLGHCVNGIFRKTKTPSIKVWHPASVWSTKGKEEYITKLYVMICTTIKSGEVTHG